MTFFDYSILAVIGFSIFIGIMRGVVKEVLSILGWLIAFCVAKTYSDELAPLLPKAIPTETMQFLAAFIILFLFTLLISALLTIALTQIFERVGLGWIDSVFGGVFGVFRGVLIVMILVLLGGLTDLPKSPIWKDAMFSAPLEALVAKTYPWIPPAMVSRVKYE
jgi:membrane protein required for colicin V production